MTEAASPAWTSQRGERTILLVVLALGAAFFLSKVDLQLGEDDLSWLRGQPPHVFDRYRVLPLLVLTTLHALVGLHAPAALAMVLVLHCLNGLMVHELVKGVTGDAVAGLAAAAVFGINPITLGTLTWISCFSYVLGTASALSSLLCVHRANLPATRYPALWLALALVLFAAALLSSHVTLFLPVLLLMLCLMQSRVWRGVVFFGLSMAMAMLVTLLFYRFGDLGIEGTDLASLGFVLAWTSSVLSSGVVLFLAYPLSFLTHVEGLLRIFFSEPARWALTLVVVAAGVLIPVQLPVLSWRSGGLSRERRSRLPGFALVVSYSALITPYIIRLYLTPDSVNYHISYVLSGRVFYLPFTVIALVWGVAVGRIVSAVRGRRWSWLLLLLPLAAYALALWLYGPDDFVGLNVTRTLDVTVPPRWNPYEQQQPLWFLVALVVMAGLLLIRRVKGRVGPTGTAGTDRVDDRS
jgi:hypothetical protein